MRCGKTSQGPSAAALLPLLLLLAPAPLLMLPCPPLPSASAELKKKEDAKVKAENQRKRQIKKEMAEETAKAAKDQAQADKVRGATRRYLATLLPCHLATFLPAYFRTCCFLHPTPCFLRPSQVRYEKAQAERVEMVRHLKMDMKLRDEDEIANERREGSSMSKGGKADFVSAAKTAGNDDMVGF